MPERYLFREVTKTAKRNRTSHDNHVLVSTKKREKDKERDTSLRHGVEPRRGWKKLRVTIVISASSVTAFASHRLNFWQIKIRQALALESYRNVCFATMSATAEASALAFGHAPWTRTLAMMHDALWWDPLSRLHGERPRCRTRSKGIGQETARRR
jgi:hypothetical protein